MIATTPRNTYDLLYRSQQKLMDERRRIFRMASEKPNGKRSKEKLMMDLITYAFLLRNEMINDHMAEALMMLRRNKKLYKFEIKKQANLCEESRDKYEGGGGILSEIGVLGNMLDTLNELYDEYKSRFNNTTTQLYYAIKQKLDDARLEHSALIAQMELTRIIIEAACFRADSDIKYDIVLQPVIERLRYMKPEGIRLRFNKLCDMVYTKTAVGTIDLNTPRSEAAFKNFARQLNDYDIINDTILTVYGTNQ